MAGPNPTLPDVLAGLESSERWPATQLLEGQRMQLGALLRWCVTNVPYYSKLKHFRVALSAAERDPDSFARAWRTLPLLPKSVLRDQAPQLCAARVPETHMPLGKTLTSGSTGIPVEVTSTGRSAMMFQAQCLRENLWQKRDVKKRFGTIRYVERAHREPNGSIAPTWGPIISRLYASGQGGFIHVGYPIDVIAAWLRRFDPHYMMTYPSVVAALMEEMKEKPVSLEEVSCFGEPLAPDLIARLRDVWNVRVSENYSTNETGYIAIRCPDSDDLHIQSEGAFVEILGESGAPCEVGQSGRVVVTPLHNLAMPLIRYDIGDYATVGAPCRCGRGLPVIRQVLGRERNFAQTPEGTRYWPVDLGKLREIRAVRQFQFVQTAQDTIQLRLVLNQPLTTDEHQRAMDLTRIALGYPFNVEIIPVPRIERGPGGKFEDFLSLLPKT